MGRWLRGHTGWAGMMREDRPKEPAWWTTREDLKTQWILGATREIRLSGRERTPSCLLTTAFDCPRQKVSHGTVSIYQNIENKRRRRRRKFYRKIFLKKERESVVDAHHLEEREEGSAEPTGLRLNAARRSIFRKKSRFQRWGWRQWCWCWFPTLSFIWLPLSPIYLFFFFIYIWYITIK